MVGVKMVAERYRIGKGVLEMSVRIIDPPKPKPPVLFHDLIEKEAGDEPIIAIAMVSNHSDMAWPWKVGESVTWETAKPWLAISMKDGQTDYGYPPAEIIAWTTSKVIYHHRDNEYAPTLDSVRRNP